jgi:hypothetical protein
VAQWRYGHGQRQHQPLDLDLYLVSILISYCGYKERFV